tara:strand:+ start:519 stop:998 length:480 start_codon:yes stop_codon:yes gene_type:complete
MRPECLEFSPVDCLEMVKEVNPTFWTVDLVKPCTQLMKYRSLHKISHQQALDACLAVTRNMAENILFLAAHQHIIMEKVTMYNDAVENIALYQEQLLHLNNNTKISENEKRTLREFYQDKLQDLEQEREKLLLIQEVRNQLQVNYDVVSKKVNTNTKSN